MKYYSNCLILRLRMPVSDDLHSRNFVTKIAKYERVVDIPNSNTILTDLLPASILLAEHKETGIYNFTNPGAISHNEVLALFKEYVRPEFTWKNFTLEEQAKVIKAGYFLFPNRFQIFTVLIHFTDAATASWTPPSSRRSSRSTVTRSQKSTRPTNSVSSACTLRVSNKVLEV